VPVVDIGKKDARTKPKIYSARRDPMRLGGLANGQDGLIKAQNLLAASIFGQIRIALFD